MIHATTPIQLNHVVKSTVEKGEPFSSGELVLIEDAGRVLVGPQPNVGNIRSDRLDFPFENIEVLTETSVRNSELFSLNVRNQTREQYYLPAAVANNAYVSNGVLQTPPTPIMIRDYDGALAQNLALPAGSVSATIDYLVYYDSNAAPVQAGVLRILASDDQIIMTDTNTAPQGISFSVIPNPDNTGDYLVEATNPSLTQPIYLQVRKTVIAVGDATPNGGGGGNIPQ